MEARTSDDLCDKGFFCVANTTEYPGMCPQPVPLGLPLSWDSNNGVTVAYDELRRPWIIRSERLQQQDFSWLNHNFRRGAHVPHSNDGGQFIGKAQPGN